MQKREVPEWSSGSLIGDRYLIDRVIGHGGMGVVYAVRDMKLSGSRRALKLVQSANGEGGFAAEAAHLIKLNHPNLPVIFDYLQLKEHGQDAIVTDFIEGHTLAELYADPLFALPFEQIVKAVLQLCSALHYLHSLPVPIIHRDLKPSNVMIDSGGCVKLIDFGISRTFKAGRQQDTVQLGTVVFAAPEQLALRQSDERTDIYGLGMLLYYMASGGRVYSAHDAAPLRKRLPADLPGGFVAIVERMLEYDPAFRYSSMREAEEALQRFDNNRPPNGHIDRLSSIGRKSGRTPLVSILSLSSSAGATFITQLLAGMASEYGIWPVSAVEYAGLKAEWQQLLPADLTWQTAESGAALSESRFVHGTEANCPISWYALNGQCLHSQNNPEADMEQIMRLRGEGLTLVDFSREWERSDAWYWLVQAQIVLVVADPYAAKWQAASLRKLQLLQQELHRSGGKLIWVANKDVSFAYRRQWFGLMPDRPLSVVPLMPSDVMLNMLWSGKKMRGRSSPMKRVYQALQPVMRLLQNEFNANRH